MKALQIAASGMNAQQTRIDTVANNLANVNTTSFKRSQAAFQDVFYQELGGGARGARADLGGGTRLSGLVKDHSSGTVTQTGNAYDVALVGSGFLRLTDPQGAPVYTRDGSLRVQADGVLRNATGLPLAGDIVVPDDIESLRIDEMGAVYGRFAGDASEVALGQLEVVQFANPSGLQALGSNLYGETQTSGEAVFDDGATQVMQGHLESSNVDAAEELIELVAAQRAFELNSKVVQAADEAMQIAANLKR